MLEDVTAISVCYNTRTIFKRAYDSFRRFYPDMKIIIVDNSGRRDPCASYAQSLKSDTTTVITPGRNIGHGLGMDAGIRRAGTKYALLFDSDIVIKDDCLDLMLSRLQDDSFGIGKVRYVNNSGKNTKAYYSNPRIEKHYRLYHRNQLTSLKRKMGIPYLHPHFHLINIENYRKYKPYIHHGAPCLQTMIDIAQKGLSKKILIDFPVDKYVQHDGKGTRKIYPLDHRKEPWQWKT